MKVELLDQRAPDQSGHLLIQLNGHDQQIGIERLFEMELDALANHFIYPLNVKPTNAMRT
jgi:hypothetical protein